MAGPSIARAQVTVDLDGSHIPAEAKALGEEAGALAGDGYGEKFNDRVEKTYGDLREKTVKEMQDSGKLAGDRSGEEFSKAFDSRIKGDAEKLNRDLADIFARNDGIDHFHDSLKHSGDDLLGIEGTVSKIDDMLLEAADNGSLNHKQLSDLSDEAHNWGEQMKEGVGEYRDLQGLRLNSVLDDLQQAKGRERDMADEAGTIKQAFHDLNEERLNGVLDDLKRGRDESKRLKGAFEDVKGEIADLRYKQLRPLTDELERVFEKKGGLETYRRSLQAVKGDFVTVEDAAKLAKGKLDEYEKAVGSVDSVSQHFRGELDKFSKTSVDWRKEVQRAITDAKNLRDPLDKVGGSAKNAHTDYDRFWRMVGSGNHDIETAGSAIKALGGEIETSSKRVEGGRGPFSKFFGLFGDSGTIARGAESIGKKVLGLGDDAGKGSKGIDKAAGSFGGLGSALGAINNPGIIAGVAAVIGFLPQLSTLAAAAGGGLLILGGGATAALAGAGGLYLAFSNILGPLGKLPANVQPAAKAIQELAGGTESVNGKLVKFPGLIAGVRDALQSSTFEGLAGPIRELTKTLIPSLETDMGTLGGALNTVLKRWATDLASSGFQKDLADIFTGMKPVIEDLGGIISKTFGIIGQLLIDALPYVHQFTHDTNTLLGSFLDFLKSPQGHTAVADWLETTKKVLGEVGKVIGDTAGQLVKLVTPKNIGDTMKSLQDLGKAAGDLAKASNNISTLSTDVVAAVAVITDAGNQLSTVFDPMLTGIEVVGFAVIGGMDTLGKTIHSMIAGIVGDMAAAFGGVGQAIGDALSGNFDKAGRDLKKATDAMTHNANDMSNNLGAAFGNAVSQFNTLPPAAQDMSLKVAHNFGLTGDKAKGFAGQLAEMAKTGKVDLKTLGNDKSVDALAQHLGITTGAAKILLQGLNDTSSKGAQHLSKLKTDASHNLSGVDSAMGATGKANEVLTKAFEKTAGNSKSALSGLAGAKSWGDIEHALGGAGTAAKTKMADNIIAAAHASGLSISALPPQIQALVTKYGTIPKDKHTHVYLDGAAAAVSAANSVGSALAALHDKRINITQIVSQIGDPGKLGHTAIGGIMAGGQLVAGGMAFATGGILSSPSWFGNVLAGEAGAEAIVPLSKPLAQVDPSVRNLAAVAQGMSATTDKSKPGAYIAPGAIQIVTPASDPAIVASQAIDRLVPLL